MGANGTASPDERMQAAGIGIYGAGRDPHLGAGIERGEIVSGSHDIAAIVQGLPGTSGAFQFAGECGFALGFITCSG